MDKYYVRLTNGFFEVKGVPVVVDGYEEYDFFIHRPIFPARGCSFEWYVSEGRSGTLVAVGDGETDAVDQLKTTLNKIGDKTRIDAAIATAISSSGLSPRHTSMDKS